jgi:bifunctional non-homologous end joining protein LigD
VAGAPQAAWTDRLDEDQRARLHAYDQPGPPSPMLARLAEPSEVPTGWGFQRKWDGMRVLARTGPHPRLWARSGRIITDTFPEIADQLAATPREAIVDGEIVVLRGDQERFALLQHRMHVEDPAPSLVDEIPVQWVLFDVLALEGLDVRRLPHRRREALLHELAPELGEVILTETVAHGQPAGQVQQAACQLGWEGLIAKDPDSSYRGGRHSAWRKLKCLQRDTFVVVGYRELAPGGVGSLVLARETEHGLEPAGSVGTGLTDDERVQLRGTLDQRRRASPPVSVDEVRGEVRWVEPELAIAVAYSKATPDGSLRHPRLAGLGTLKPREARA